MAPGRKVDQLPSSMEGILHSMPVSPQSHQPTFYDNTHNNTSQTDLQPSNSWTPIISPSNLQQFGPLLPTPNLPKAISQSPFPIPILSPNNPNPLFTVSRAQQHSPSPNRPMSSPKAHYQRNQWTRGSHHSQPTSPAHYSPSSPTRSLLNPRKEDALPL